MKYLKMTEVYNSNSIFSNVYRPLISSIGIHHPKIKTGKKLDAMGEVWSLATFSFKTDATCGTSTHCYFTEFKVINRTPILPEILNDFF